jgi:transposase
MAKITRALKFEASFPGWRTKDLTGVSRTEAKKGKRTERVTEKVKKRKKKKSQRNGLYMDLWSAQDDLTVAANRLVSALYQLMLGTLEWPLKEDGSKVNIRTIAYWGMNGTWQPFGEPFYQPERRAVSSHVLLETANTVYTRIKTDFFEIKTGRKALSTFRRIPIGMVRQGIRVAEDGTIRLSLWKTEKGKKGAQYVRIRPRKLDGGQRAVLQRCADKEHEYRHGCGRLYWYQPTGRKGRWMTSLAWTGTVEQVSSTKPLVAGVHLGMLTAASVAYKDMKSGRILRDKDLFDLPRQAVRAVERARTERKSRSLTNRDVFQLRTGRGRQRKLRVTSVLSDRVRRLNDTAVRQLAGALVRQVKEKGAVIIALEDLKHWSRDRALDESELRSRRARAEHRKWYFRWLQGSMRAAIMSAAEREGLVIVEVDAAYDSRSCSTCDSRYVQVETDPDGNQYGRVEWSRFRCRCGTDLHADRNAAINVVRRGMELYEEKQKEAAAK